MAIVTGDLLAAIATNFRRRFAESFEAAQALQGWQQLTDMVPSNGAQNTYAWFGTPPKMTDVTHGSTEIASLPPYSFTIVNNEYQATLEVERAAIERDQLNLIVPRIGQLGAEAARHPGELILDLVRQNAVGYDGAAFFADTRVIGNSANIDNNIAGTGTSVAQFQTDLAAARAQMRLFQDDQGRRMNLIGNVIMVPAQLEQVAYQALSANQGNINQPVVTPTTQNGLTIAGSYTIIVNPFLTDVNDWYLFHVGPGEDRPFIFQSEKEPILLSATDINSEYFIRTRKMLNSVYGRYNVGLTDPRFGVRTTNT